MRCERIGGVSGTGRNVDHPPRRLRLHQFDQPLEAPAFRMRLARQIMRGGSAELFLHQRFGHRDTLS